MKRMHIHLSVAELDRTVAFYSRLFGADPTVLKSDYAKWMLDDPRVNFAVSVHDGVAKGVEHVGIQAESGEELGEVYGRIAEAGRPFVEEGQTTCCYAQSEKGWVSDPDGVLWEAFLTNGESTVYGDRAQAANAASAACCDSETPQGVCCPPKPEAAPEAACCGAD